MNKLINFEINGLAFCWRWKVFPSLPEPTFHYLSKVLVTRTHTYQYKKISKNKNFFLAKDLNKKLF